MSPRKWIPALVTVLFLTGCSATDRRISANEDLFETYPPEIQAIIKSNRIDRGFDSTQVYMSFGNADRTEMDGGQEIWFYHQAHKRNVKEEKTAAEYREELSAYEYSVHQGNQNAQEPLTYRVITLHRTSVYRLVRFENGRVVSWEEPDEMWLDDWHQ